MPELATVWFWLVGALLGAWVVLDGFDFGVGVLHRVVAKTDEERRTVLAAIGPVWDGNEVWLLAAGGSMFLAFPRLVGAAFSGFYLPLVFLVWGLILRGVSIELRSHVGSPLWRSFFDTTFVVGSAVVAVLMGALLGDLVRGVPLDADGFFELPLFSGDGPGVVDGYTALVAVLSLVTLSAHGASWLVLKTAGAVQARARRLRLPLWVTSLVLWLAVAVATSRVAPERFAAFAGRPATWGFLLVALGGAVVVVVTRALERAPFFGGVAFLAGQLLLVLGTGFPVLLRGTTGHSLTVAEAAAAETSLRAGLVWWGPAVLLAAGYLWWVLRHFRGKAEAARDGEGY